MVLAGDKLFIAGWRDAVAITERTGRALDPNEPDPRQSVLRCISTGDGRTAAEYPLDAEPVFDGMAAAYSRLYISTVDGGVVCLGAN
jgi:hypothetical protein